MAASRLASSPQASSSSAPASLSPVAAIGGAHRSISLQVSPYDSSTSSPAPMSRVAATSMAHSPSGLDGARRSHLSGRAGEVARLGSGQASGKTCSARDGEQPHLARHNGLP